MCLCDSCELKGSYHEEFDGWLITIISGVVSSKPVESYGGKSTDIVLDGLTNYM